MINVVVVLLTVVVALVAASFGVLTMMMMMVTVFGAALLRIAPDAASVLARHMMHFHARIRATKSEAELEKHVRVKQIAEPNERQCRKGQCGDSYQIEFCKHFFYRKFLFKKKRKE